jgi:hypothetical protein
VPRLRFGQDDVRFELRRVRCGLPTIRALAPAIVYRGAAELHETRDCKQIIAVTPRTEPL